MRVFGVLALALLLTSVQAADPAPLERVAGRLRVAAAPWCDRVAELGVDGLRRCTVAIESMPAAGAHNAWAFLGNHRVTEAMLALLDENELAHVIGHELAHTVLGHGISRARREPKLHALLPLLEGSLPLPHEQVAVSMHGQELDADALGLYFAGLAGYPVSAQARWWRRAPDWLPEAGLASDSHPAAAQRASAAAAVAARFCEQLGRGELLQPDAARLRVAYENREDEIRRQQQGLDPRKVCAP